MGSIPSSQLSQASSSPPSQPSQPRGGLSQGSSSLGVEDDFDLTPSLTATTAGNPLATFVETIALNSSDDAKSKGKSDREMVTISSIHAAKGLEWACVFVVGVEEGIIPHKSATDSEQLREERRLLYVACTRAKFYLVLLRARSRMSMGHRGNADQSSLITQGVMRKFLVSRVLEESDLMKHQESLQNFFQGPRAC